MEQLTFFTFFGLGLIGGSIARAIGASHPDCFIRACDTDSSTLRLALEGKASLMKRRNVYR